MSERPVEQQFKKRLDEIRRELADDGWEVLGKLVDPPVPARLIELEPDIVARKGSELLVGEVKSRNSTSLDVLTALAETVAKLPNARLEVYWLGDEPEVEPTRERIRELVREALTLSTTGHLAAATVIAWAALEGALERYAADPQVPVTVGSARAITAWPLLSRLYSLGYLSESDYERLREVRRQRNAAVHFGHGELSQIQDIQYTLALVDRLLSGQYVSVDQMMEWYVDRYDYPQAPEAQSSIQAILREQFPGASESDVYEAISRLIHDAAI
jgi:hypothetical protein